MTSFSDAFNTLGGGLHHVLSTVGQNGPHYIAAFLIVLMGAIAGFLAKWIVVFILRSINLRNVSKTVRWNMVFGDKYDGVELVGDFARWLLILTFFVYAMQVVDVPSVTSVVGRMLGYLPHLFVAAVVLGVGGVFANLAGRLVAVVGRLFGFRFSTLVGWLASTALWVVWGLVALSELQLPAAYISFLYYFVAGMLALAGGLAFGLGARDWAAGATKGMFGHFRADKEV